MSRDTTVDGQFSVQITEALRGILEREERRLKQLFSGSLLERWKLAAIAAIAILRGRAGRSLVMRLVMVGVLFVYQYLIIVEIIISLVVIAQLAIHFFPAFISKLQARRDGLRHLPVGSSTMVTTGAITNTTNDSNSSQRRGAPGRQAEQIQRHLQQLAAAAAAAQEAPTWPNQGWEELAAGFPDRAQTIATTPPEIRHRDSNRSSTQMTVRPSQQQHITRRRSNPTELAARSSRSLLLPVLDQQQQLEEPIVIHIQLPIYVCALTFWNDIYITVPTLMPPPSPAAPNRADPNSSSSASTHRNGGAQRLFYQIEMRMWAESNPDLITGGSSNRSGKSIQCEQCQQGTHSVGRRRFECTHMNGRVDVHRNTFHEGRKLTFINKPLPNGGLNFKFETTLEQTSCSVVTKHARNESGSNVLSTTGSNAFAQQATFKLLPPKSNPEVENRLRSSEGDGEKASKLRQQGANGGGLLPYLMELKSRRSHAQAVLAPISQCSVEAHYRLEDRRDIRRNRYADLVRKSITSANDDENPTTYLLTTKAL